MATEAWKQGLEPCTCPDGVLVARGPDTGQLLYRQRLKAHCPRCSKEIQEAVRQEQEQLEQDFYRDEQMAELRTKNEKLELRLARIEQFLAAAARGEKR